MTRPPNNFDPFNVPPPTMEQLGIIHPKQRGMGFRAFRIVCLIFFCLSTAFTTGAYLWLDNLGVFAISDESVRVVQQHRIKDNSVVLDRKGRKVGEFFDSFHHYVPYDKIPPAFIDAILSIEDRNFYSHFGIDIKAIIRASKAVVEGGRFKQGASTITQQVVRHFLLRKDKTLHRKIREIALSIRLEQIITKDKILEIYANALFLGNGSYGIGAAAHRYFGKPIQNLGVHQLALIAGLYQSPSRYNPTRHPKRAKERQWQVLRAMVQNGRLTMKEAEEAYLAPLEYVDYESINEKIAPHFIDYIRDRANKVLGKRLEGTGLRIYTTLDLDIQKTANQVLADHQEHLSKADKLVVPNYRKHKRGETPGVEAAILVMDPTNGEILAMIGGRDYNQSKYNRTTQARRQPGSAFKPVVYSLALKRGFRWSDMLFVSPVQMDGYRPKNFSSKFLTETTMLRAFYKSLNTATIEIGSKIGLKEIIEHAAKLGITSKLKMEPGTMLGSSEVSMQDLATAYSVFANKGRKTNPIAITKIETRDGKSIYDAPALRLRQERAISPQIAFLMTQGMRSVLARGTASKASRHAGRAAGKTGTSNNSIDNWFAGFTTNLVTVVWVGTDSQLAMRGKATGGDLALPIWDEFMHRAYAIRKPSHFRRPAGIIGSNINSKYGSKGSGGMRMYFLSTNRPSSGHNDFKEMENKNEFRSLYSY